MPFHSISAACFSKLLFIGVFWGILSSHAITIFEHASSEFAFIRQTGFQHEVSVSLKLIQVYVTDKKGFPVTGLSKNDFILYDNGQEMKLTEFESHESAVVQTPQPIQKTPLLKRKLFFIFDFAYADPQGILMARNKAIHFLESRLQSSDEVGVLSFEGTRSLRVHEFLSGNRENIRKIIASFGPHNVINVAIDPKGAQLEDEIQTMSRSGKIEKGKASRSQARSSARNFIWAMTAFAQSLRYLPGQKTIILLSSGIPGQLLYKGELSWNENSNMDLRFVYDDMGKEFSNANAAVYPINTEPLSENSDSLSGVVSLEKLANASGGQYLGRAIGSADQFVEIQRLTESYYVIGYPATKASDARFHKVKVIVTRPDCIVRAQSGYFNPKPFPEYSELEKKFDLVDLALAETPLSQVPTRFPLSTFPITANPPNNIGLIAEIPAKELHAVLGKTTEVFGLVFNASDDLVDSRRNIVDFSKFTNKIIYSSFVLSAPPGLNKYRIIIRNLQTGRAAVASAGGNAPFGHADEPSLYPPLLLTSPEDCVFIDEKDVYGLNNQWKPFLFTDLFHFHPASNSPLLGKNLKSGSEFHALFRCAGQKRDLASAKLTASLTVMETDRTIGIPIEIISTSLDRKGVYWLAQLSLPKIEPGVYSLIVTIVLPNNDRSSIRSEFIID